MTSIFDDRAYKGTLTRRDFIRLSALAAVSTAVAGCAANPVTGQSQLMLMGEGEEIQIDRVNAPHQFSADYGVTQDAALLSYVGGVGARLARVTHRTHMPYRFTVVNATYVNAYAFPGEHRHHPRHPRRTGQRSGACRARRPRTRARQCPSYGGAHVQRANTRHPGGWGLPSRGCGQ